MAGRSCDDGPRVRIVSPRAATRPGRLYYKPLAQEQIDRIAEGGLAAFAGAGELMAEGLHDMERALSKRHSGTRQELAVDFTGAFAGTSSWKGRYATPYESVFTSEEGLLFQDSYHEVYRLYRQNSVRKSPGYDFPDDLLVYCFRHFSRSGRALYLPFQIWDKGRVEGGGRRTTSWDLALDDRIAPPTRSVTWIRQDGRSGLDI